MTIIRPKCNRFRMWTSYMDFSWPTQPFILSGLINEQYAGIRCVLPFTGSAIWWKLRRLPQSWQKVMAAYCQVYGVIHFTSPAGWLPVHRDQLRAQRSVTSMGKLYLFIWTSRCIESTATWWCRGVCVERQGDGSNKWRVVGKSSCWRRRHYPLVHRRRRVKSVVGSRPRSRLHRHLRHRHAAERQRRSTWA